MFGVYIADYWVQSLGVERVYSRVPSLEFRGFRAKGLGCTGFGIRVYGLVFGGWRGFELGVGGLPDSDTPTGRPSYILAFRYDATCRGCIRAIDLDLVT